jgi:hypothetical protein
VTSKRRSKNISRNFELRYIDDSDKAPENPDLSGGWSHFRTEDKVALLGSYAEYGAHFFGDPNLDTQVVPEHKAQEVAQGLKVQPLPEVRRRLRLCQWKAVGFSPEAEAGDRSRADRWWQVSGVTVERDRLLFSEAASIELPFVSQKWRFSITFQLAAPAGVSFDFTLMDKKQEMARINLPASGDREDRSIKLEVDLPGNQFQITENEIPVISWTPMAKTKVGQIDGLRIEAGKGAAILDVHGVGYTPVAGDPHRPYAIKTFLDERFSLRPDITGWDQVDYDDSGWDEREAPVVHGGERYHGEDLYLRTMVKVGTFSRAVLCAEVLDPAGDIRVNGTVVAADDKRRPLEIDITRYLKPDAENLIAVHVQCFTGDLGGVGHAPADTAIGWFAGRIHIDLTETDYIRDVFAYTRKLTRVSSGASPVERNEFFQADETESTAEFLDSIHAQLSLRVRLGNCDKEGFFEGRLRAEVSPWFPEERAEIVGQTDMPVRICEWNEDTVEMEIDIQDAKAWTPEAPNLYRVRVYLFDKDGTVIDDEVITTGLRTISQEGGVFRLNGRPEMLRGAQIFGFRYPLEKIAAWQRCPPVHCLVREVMQIKAMNCNMMRIHVHAWAHLPPARGINDPRLAEIGDQLGILYLWSTTSWIRSGTPWGVDLDGLPAYVKQVRNHPSIAVWEACNHPTVGQKYDRGADDWNRFYAAVHDAIYPHDPSRLILPAAIVGPAVDMPAMQRPGMTFGGMHSPLGGGHEWSRLMAFPANLPDVAHYMSRKDRAYIIAETHTVVGHPNWELARGKPWTDVEFYEQNMEERVVGRSFEKDEWGQSQALQALSAYEQLKTFRLVGFDGYSWCCLNGGANTATYKKPLIDYMGHAKLSWYAVRMVSQSVLACSTDSEIRYTSGRPLRAVVLNIGPERRVNVIVRVHDLDGETVAEKIFSDLLLPAGRTCSPLPAVEIGNVPQGGYVVVYEVNEYE